MKKLLIAILLSFSFVASAQQLNIALLKYRGGGGLVRQPDLAAQLGAFLQPRDRYRHQPECADGRAVIA